MKIIDFHMHPFIDEDENFCHYKDSLDIKCEDIGEDMKKAGVSVFCGSVIKRDINGFETLKNCNRHALKLREMYGNRYIPGFHINPLYIRESYNELEFAAKNKIKLIGELVPYMHNWSDYSSPEFSELLDAVAPYNFVVSLHTIDISQMEKMASEHKNITFVFAHPGEKSSVLNHIDVMKKLDNVYLDISGTGLFRYGLLKHLVSKVGAERILFGTDYPICNIQMYINGVMGEKISDTDKEQIMYKNAQRLLDIKLP